MTTDTADKIAKLEAEVAELKAKVSPPKSNFVPMSDAEWIDQMHQMRERRMSFASNFHPDDLRAMEAACPTPMMKEIALRDARAPTGPSNMNPSSTSRGGSPANVPGSGTGWVEPAPLVPPPGLRYVDAQIDAADARDKAERIRQDVQLKAMEKMAEQTETMRQQTEALGKLVEQKNE